MNVCRIIGCDNRVLGMGQDFCQSCTIQRSQEAIDSANEVRDTTTQTLSKKYRHHFKSVADVDEIDVYSVHQLFNLQDPSGCIQSASKKLLMSSSLRNDKTTHQLIEEARDSLSRWLQLNTAD